VLLKFALAGAVAALLVALIAQYQNMRDLRERLEQAEHIRAGYAHAIDQLGQQARDNAADAARLTAQLQQLRLAESRRDQQWEQLKRDHQELKDWAGTVLPAAVQRLHQRPAITGAAEYQHWLQQGHGLRPAPEQPGQQRGSEPGHPQP
jgi:LysB family phage lysis regulatory protein